MYNEYLQEWLVEPSGLVDPAFREYYRMLDLQSILTWEYFASYSMWNMPFLLPLFSVLPCIPFTFELRSYFILGRHRFKSLSIQYYRMILKYAFISSSCVTLSMTFVFSIVGFFLIPSVRDLGSIDDWFPQGFYEKSPLFVFIFMILGYYGPMIFSYALLTLGLMLWTKRVYVVPILVYLTFIGQTKLAHILDSSALNIQRNIVAYNILTPLPQMYVSIGVVAFLACIIIYFGVKKACREYNV
ncbi:MAG: hypothetical protein RR651_00950 [Lysinibacillus sp.]